MFNRRDLLLSLLVSLPGGAVLAQPTFGPELRVNRNVAGDQNGASVAAASDGTYLMLWSDQGYDLQGQRLEGAGNRVGNEFRLEGWGGETSSVAVDTAGEFVVLWGGFYELVAQRFGPSGDPRTDPIGVTFGYARYFYNDVAMTRGGGFVAAWAGYVFAGSGTEIVVRRFDRDGNYLAGDVVARSAVFGTKPAVASAPDLGFVVVWSAGSGDSAEIRGRRFSREVVPLGADFQVSTDATTPKSEVEVGVALDGSFIVVWQSNAQDGDAGGIFGQRFDSAGGRAGPEFRVNTQRAGDQADPSVAVGAAGDFVVVWTSQGQDGSDAGVFGQFFDAHGRPIGDEVRFNVRTEGPQGRPSVAIARDGGIVVAWDGPPELGASHDVFARRSVTASGDLDGDGVPDPTDNCPTRANPDQTDANGDGYGDTCVSPAASLDPRARLGANPIVGAGTVVEAFVVIGDDAVLGENGHVGRGCVAGNRLFFEDSVSLGRRCRIGTDVTIGAGTRTEALVTIGGGVAIGDQVLIRRAVVIEAEATIEPLVVIHPAAQIGAGATIEMGATIGRGARVLAGAIVPAGTSVPPGATVHP